MVGNDIVDIKEAEHASNWTRPRFLSKIFTSSEQEIINKSIRSSQMVWCLWTMKEAAYKLYTQIHPCRFYNPRAFECTFEGLIGKVRYGSFVCCVKTIKTTNYILSEAQLNPKDIKSKIVILNGDNYKLKSSRLKMELLGHISKTFDNSLSVQFHYDSNGIPMLKVNDKRRSVSLTHHGRFGAFAIA